jgi:hypothetical protein
MALKVPSLGELELLDKLLKDALSTNEDYILALYKDDKTPGDNDAVPASFTQCDFTNYVVKTLTRAGWTSAVLTNTYAESSYGTVQAWTCGTVGNTVYGYFVYGSNSNQVLWAERFATARIVAQDDILNITPKFTLMSES